MLEFETKYFGKVPYAPGSVIEFPLGLPGFENEHRFVLIEQSINKPIVFLQSLSQPELCFPTAPVSLLCPNYELTLSAEDLFALGCQEQPVAGQDTLLLAIVSLAPDGPATANLLSPVVIHWRTRLAVQAIQTDSPHSHQHPLLAPTPVAPCL